MTDCVPCRYVSCGRRYFECNRAPKSHCLVQTPRCKGKDLLGSFRTSCYDDTRSVNGQTVSPYFVSGEAPLPSKQKICSSGNNKVKKTSSEWVGYKKSPTLTKSMPTKPLRKGATEVREKSEQTQKLKTIVRIQGRTTAKVHTTVYRDESLGSNSKKEKPIRASNVYRTSPTLPTIQEYIQPHRTFQENWSVDDGRFCKGCRQAYEQMKQQMEEVATLTKEINRIKNIWKSFKSDLGRGDRTKKKTCKGRCYIRPQANISPGKCGKLPGSRTGYLLPNQFDGNTNETKRKPAARCSARPKQKKVDGSSINTLRRVYKPSQITSSCTRSSDLPKNSRADNQNGKCHKCCKKNLPKSTTLPNLQTNSFTQCQECGTCGRITDYLIGKSRSCNSQNLSRSSEEMLICKVSKTDLTARLHPNTIYKPCTPRENPKLKSNNIQEIIYKSPFSSNKNSSTTKPRISNCIPKRNVAPFEEKIICFKDPRDIVTVTTHDNQIYSYHLSDFFHYHCK